MKLGLDALKCQRPNSSFPQHLLHGNDVSFRLIAPTPSAPAVDLDIGPIGHALRPPRREAMCLIPASIVPSSSIKVQSAVP